MNKESKLEILEKDIFLNQMNKPLTSIYTTAFNLSKCEFWEDFHKFIVRNAPFADEIVVATLPQEEGEILEKIHLDFPRENIRVVYPNNLSYDSFSLDGKLKDFALKSCDGNILIQLDLDEYLQPNYPWISFFESRANLIFSSHVLMLPSFNLVGDESHYSSINIKWYVHGRDYSRGVQKHARLDDSKFPDWPTSFSKESSDGCELLDKNGELPSKIIQSVFITQDWHCLLGAPYIIHEGYLSLERKAKRNREFWKQSWYSYGEEDAVDVKTNASDFQIKGYKHGLFPWLE